MLKENQRRELFSGFAGEFTNLATTADMNGGGSFASIWRTGPSCVLLCTTVVEVFLLFSGFEFIIPQSICTRYGLAIGAAVTPFVRVLLWVCFPIAYPISKLLIYLLGHGHVALFRRAELKTLVDFHGNEAGKGGELTHDETTIIAGALELSEKTASDAMTPIAETFAIDINDKLDSLNEIEAKEEEESNLADAGEDIEKISLFHPVLQVADPESADHVGTGGLDLRWRWGHV
ncbi:hypothetical protein ACLB2K_022476 [Fragaria x ananassa]